MIFRVTWTESSKTGPSPVEGFFSANTADEAKLLAGRWLAKNDVEAKEWIHCMAPQHAQIPTVPNLDRHSRQIEPAVMVHGGTPYCARCIEHKYSEIVDRVERLERALCELQDSLDLHTEDHP